MAGHARWRAARGAGALLVALGAITLGGLLLPRRQEVDLDATVERVAARLREVNALLEPRALAERVARLRGMVEEELGEPIPGEVEAIPIGRKAWAERLAMRSAGLPWSGEVEQMRAWLRAFSDAFAMAQWTVATYDAERDVVDLLGQHFAEEADPGTREALLDITLAHELVHVWHQRAHPDAPLLAKHDDPECAVAAGAAAEGHAQAVARRVATRLGHADRFDLVDIRLDDPWVDRLPAADREQTLALRAPRVFRYRTGERYVAALVERLGMRESGDRLAR